MKRYLSMMLAAALLSGMMMCAWAYDTPKREFRSAWIATVWCLDWPSQGAGATKQKQQMDRLLDSLQINNFNAVNFQVRSMCDAMYQSSIEPWSSYLTGTRGADPGFDPLQYVVEGCHKRGMECHAWVNPYRWSTGTNWNTPYDQELKNDGWLLTYGSTIILDPGQQRTIDRIVAVCHEIISNYDVDGILYDDYFYPSGIPADASAEDYGEWQASGTSLSFADWRRDNVNRMVQAVYDMIQETRPEVRYGISPAGVAASSSAVASQHGVEPCPTGSDWQYNGIFSDPLAWLEAQSIDYISPQVYWPFGHSTNDYGLISGWWGQIADHFGRQVYISSSISGLTGSSTAVQYKEYADEVEFNRTSSVDGNPGAIFYSCKYLYAISSNPLGHYLKNTVFTKPALPPTMTWKHGYNPGVVQNPERTSNSISWEGYDNVRYTVYAFPMTMNTTTFTGQVEYLLGMSYETEYEIPAEYQQGYQYAVCVLDRLGYEWEPAFLSAELDQLPDPVLISPADGATVDAPFQFTWHPVDGATSYLVELAKSPEFSTVLERVTVTDTVASVLQFSKLTHGEVHYWRVQSCSDSCYSGVSEVRAFTPMLLTITSPADGSEDLEVPVTATWYTCGSDEPATLQLASDDTFSKESLIYIGTSTTGTAIIPDEMLEPGNTYFLRVILTVDGETMTSNVVRFSVAHAAARFAQPVDGGTLYAGQHIALKQQQWATSYVIEVSSKEGTWGRTRFIETLKDGAYETSLPAEEIKVDGKLMEDGKIYYARCKTSYLDFDGNSHTTSYGPIISFTYRATTPPSSGDVNGDGEINIADVNAVINMILGSNPLPAGDVNGDGEVNIADVNAIINIILGH
ncbi:MAG: family 10 glycosylhydrolase [Muribaculaceae bacterium]|nr:family 10 glycosylhydrolase [Muribaculaceae bacterium]